MGVSDKQKYCKDDILFMLKSISLKYKNLMDLL